MKLLYKISLVFLPSLLKVAGVFNPKARQMLDWRRNWEEQLQGLDPDKKTFWFHCASVGEFEQGKPIIEALLNVDESIQLVVSFFSPSGYANGKSYELSSAVVNLPFDNRQNASRFLDLVKPDCAVFIKYEFWYYYLSELKHRNIPVFSVSSIFRQNQIFFKKNGEFFRRMLKRVDHFFVQNDSSKELLKKIGHDNVTVSGDTRFDRVLEIANSPRRIEIAEEFSEGRDVLVIGSSWSDDIDILLPFINDEASNVKIILAPHELNEKIIERLCNRISASHVLFSKATIDIVKTVKILIIDNVGMLSSLYQYGKVAYVGGAFRTGLHNTLEPAAFGLPVIFGKGKDTYKYQEAIDMLEAGGAFEVSNLKDFRVLTDRFFGDEMAWKNTSERIHDFMRKHAGATEKVMKELKHYVI